MKIWDQQYKHRKYVRDRVSYQPSPLNLLAQRERRAALAWNFIFPFGTEYPKGGKLYEVEMYNTSTFKQGKLGEKILEDLQDMKIFEYLKIIARYRISGSKIKQLWKVYIFCYTRWNLDLQIYIHIWKIR